MKAKTKKIRNSQFPLYDAVAIPCSEKGFSLLQWDFSYGKNKEFARYSYQLPDNAVKQILGWRDAELIFQASRNAYAQLKG